MHHGKFGEHPMQNLRTSFNGFYCGKRVLVTGHTGFKGAWITEWLLKLGAMVTGYGLAPETEPSLFMQLKLKDRINHIVGDIRDGRHLTNTIAAVKPHVLFHLAAQPLVRRSYDIPLETFEVNVMGTLNVLQALRDVASPCAAVCITTDKCYENREWLHGYRETDPMGGYDPYSASKGCAELAIDSFRRSFFSPITNPSPVIGIASARAGNVLGGGDWAIDRIMPDCIRALTKSSPIPVRNRHATRPWQHVLEPLSGYLQLGATISRFQMGVEATALPYSLADYLSAFNFGPSLSSNKSVHELVKETLTVWPGDMIDTTPPWAPHEADRLNLSTDKAFHMLAWEPVWDFSETVKNTVSWYVHAHNTPDANLSDFTRSQIDRYERDRQARSIRSDF